MSETDPRLRKMFEAVAQAIIAHAEELTELDAAIGDGDHGHNMTRGMQAVLGELDTVAAKPWNEALKAAGMQLVMKVGGASGPLYGTLFMTLGKTLDTPPTRDGLTAALHAAIEAVMARGKASAGQKTMLDVLVPVSEAVSAGSLARRGRGGCTQGLRRDERHAGDQGAGLVPGRTVGGSCRSRRPVQPDHDRGDRRTAWRREMSNVGIVIVSHSPLVAEGTADMVRQMVGDEVPLAWCGGDPDGGLGTSVEAILAAIDRAWSEAGVAMLVDLGGAETNSEMAVEMLPDARSGKVVVCNAPIVEGAVVAATEASGGASLQEVRRIAEELSAL